MGKRFKSEFSKKLTTMTAVSFFLIVFISLGAWFYKGDTPDKILDVMAWAFGAIVVAYLFGSSAVNYNKVDNSSEFGNPKYTAPIKNQAPTKKNTEDEFHI